MSSDIRAGRLANAPEKGARILVGMSGGVDSTYAAALLLKSGYSVEGAALRMNEYTDIAAAELSAKEIWIPLHVVECGEEFRRRVIENLADEYCAARTPNPCVVCNKYVKIELLTRFASENGFDRAATGHYAGVYYDGERYFIGDADDLTKNQSYVLWALSQKQLSLLYTPLCGFSKTFVRSEAASLGFSAASKRESQEICFIPDKDYAGYIERLRGKFPEGDFVDEEGKVVGRHKGIIHYTVGQRKGLGLAMNGHVFVTDIDPATNRITVKREGGEFSIGAEVSGLNFQRLVYDRSGELELECGVKIRYAAKPVPAKVKLAGDRAEVRFESPARAVTPGQSAVFYKDGDILFGGFIDRPL